MPVIDVPESGGLTFHNAPRDGDPLMSLKWVRASDLNANDYNPNMVMTPELKLLELSLLETGWIQPLLITGDGTIIDGFHRWCLSQESQLLKDRYLGLVPCCVLPLTRAEAMLLTVRINRAKGTHDAPRMSAMVKELLRVHGMSPADVAKKIGGTVEEIELLEQDDLFKHRNLDQYKYSKAWVPVETGGNGIRYDGTKHDPSLGPLEPLMPKDGPRFILGPQDTPSEAITAAVEFEDGDTLEADGKSVMEKAQTEVAAKPRKRFGNAAKKGE